MFGSVILEVAVALGLLYGVLSLASSAITEAVSATVSLRARTLRRAIVRLLGGAEDRAGDILSHPLIRGLAPPRRFAGDADDVPDYIPSRTFATALLESLSSRRRIAETMEALHHDISKESSEELRRILESLAQEAGDDIARAREVLEDWYDGAMDRVRSAYAARARWITLAAAAVTVSVLNADTLLFTGQIWENASLRAVLVAQADGIQAAAAEAEGDPEAALAMLSAFPLGWSGVEGDPRGWPGTLGGVLSKLGGLLISILAVSMGAPFWFDVLNRLVSFRTAGRPVPTLADRGGEGTGEPRSVSPPATRSARTRVT